MSTSPTLNNNFYRIRLDGDAVDNTPTWAAAENVGYTIAVETAFRIRFRPNNSGTGSAAGPFILRVSKNSGAYTAVTTSTGATLGAQSNDSSTSADETAITVWRLTSTNVTGKYDETGSATYTLGISPTGAGELEYGLILKSAGATPGDTFDFQIYNSTTAFGAFSQIPRITAAADPEPDLLANDVVSASTVQKPAVKQVHGLAANDVTSPSSVTKPALAIVVPNTALLANDVLSASSVTQPAATILRGLLANDVTSASTVTKPAVKQAHGVLANDVTSPSSVGQPAASVQRGLLANDIVSASTVSQPAVRSLQGLLAENVISASFLTEPVVGGPGQIFADDVVSLSSVTSPAIGQRQTLDAADVVSASSVTTPALVEIAGSVEQALFADNVISASFVSRPMVDRPEVVEPPGTELGGGGKVYGRGYSRKRWEDLLRHLEEERQEARQRAEAFRGKKDRARARKAAVAASEAIARAIEQEEAEEQAAAVAHAREITRMLEGASQAASLTEYLRQMEAVREAAIEMELDDEDETILLLVA